MREVSPPGHWKLEILRCEAGRLSGLIKPDKLVAGCPEIVLALGRRRLATAETRRHDGAEAAFDLAVTIPQSALSEGVHVLTLEFAASGEVLAHYPVAIGRTLDDETGVAIAALEAELAALRRAFFRLMADPPLTSSGRALIVAEAVSAVLDADPSAAARSRPWSPACPMPRRVWRRKLSRRRVKPG